MKIRYLSDFNVEKSEIFSDFDCGVILANRIYFRKYLSDFEINKLFFLISI